MAIFAMKNKVIILVEGTVCNIGQINDRNDFKKRKYLDLRLDLWKLYSDYEIMQTNTVSNPLEDFNCTLKKELSNVEHNKDVTTMKVLANSQKWIISQNPQPSLNPKKHTSFLVQELLPRRCPQQV